MPFRPVTDPELLRLLNAEDEEEAPAAPPPVQPPAQAPAGAPTLRPVTDPAVLEALNASGAEQAAPPPGDEASFGGALARGLIESVARTGEEIATPLGWVGAESLADPIEQWAQGVRASAEQYGEISGVPGWAAYIAGGAPLEIAKFAGLAGTLAPIAKARYAAALPKILQKALPWAGAGGMLESLRPGATPQSVAGEAVLGGLIPATAPLGRLSRGAIMAPAATGIALAEGQSGPEALTQGAAMTALSMIPGRERLPKARTPEERFAVEDAAAAAQERLKIEKARMSPLYRDLMTELKADPVVKKGSRVTTPAGEATILNVYDDGTASVRFRPGQQGIGKATLPISDLGVKATPESLMGRGGIIGPILEIPPIELERARQLMPEVQTALALEREVPGRIAGGAVMTRHGRAKELVENLHSSADVKRTVATLAEEQGDFRAFRGEPTPIDDLFLLHASRINPELAAKIVRWRAGDPVDDELIVGTLSAFRGAANLWDDAVRKVGKGASFNEDVLDLTTALARMNMVTGPKYGMGSAAGRHLAMFKYQNRVKADVARKLVKMMGGDKSAKTTVALLKSLDLDQVLANADTILAATRGQKFLEFWKMGLLSGPTTHIVNNTSNLLFLGLDLMEQAMAIGVSKIGPKSLVGERRYWREIPARIAAVRAFPKALENFRKAWNLEQEGFALGKVELTHRGAIGGKFGKVVRAPGRFLVAQDEFWKSFAYQMELEARATREVLANRRIPRDRRAQVIDAIIANPKKGMREAAEEAARRLTFTQELGPGLRKFQGAVQENPVAGFVIPFFRTPVNIASEGVQRFPGMGLMSKRMREGLRGADKSEYIAKQLMGLGMFGTVAGLVQQGLITGAGPLEPGRKQAKYPTWQPYSWKVPEPLVPLFGKRYLSYNRLEPVGMVIGMAADLATLGQQWDEKTWNERMESFARVFTNNLASKTFVKGLADWLNMVMNPERSMGNWTESMARSMLPASALLGQTARAIDPTRREVTNPLEAAQSQIPFLASQLPAAKTVTGEVSKYGPPLGKTFLGQFSPIYGTEISEDPVAQELGRLADLPKTADSEPLSMEKIDRKLDNVEMTPQEYDRAWGQANAEAAEELRLFVTSDFWDVIPQDEQIKQIKKVYRKARSRAYDEIRFNRFMKEYER